MVQVVQQVLMEIEPVEAERLAPDEAEVWLTRLSEGAGKALWVESWRELRAHGWMWREALCIAWLSLGKDDRGEVRSVGELCNLLGVSRQWYYEQKRRYDDQPVNGENAWEWWAERLRLSRLRGSRLSDVDGNLYNLAVAEDATAAHIKLYYQRAGVLVEKGELALRPSRADEMDLSRLSDDEIRAMADAPEADLEGDGQ